MSIRGLAQAGGLVIGFFTAMIAIVLTLHWISPVPAVVPPGPSSESREISSEISRLHAENEMLEEAVKRMYSQGETGSDSYNLTTRRVLQNSLEIRDLRAKRGYQSSVADPRVGLAVAAPA